MALHFIAGPGGFCAGVAFSRKQSDLIYEWPIFSRKQSDLIYE